MKYNLKLVLLGVCSPFLGTLVMILSIIGLNTVFQNETDAATLRFVTFLFFIVWSIAAFGVVRKYWN